MPFANLSTTSAGAEKVKRFELGRRKKTKLVQSAPPADPDLVDLDTIAAEPITPETTMRILRLTPRKTLRPGERKWLHDEIRKLVLSIRPPAAIINEFVSAAAKRFNVVEDLIWPAMDNLRQYMSTTTRLHDYQCSQIIAGVVGVDRSRVYSKLSECLDAQKPMVVTVFLDAAGSPSPAPTDVDKIGYQTIEYVPDIQTQMKAVQMGVALFGGQSPQTVQHQHGLDADLQNVTEEALRLEAAGLMVELAKLGIDVNNSGLGLPGLTIDTKTEEVNVDAAG